MIAFGAKTPLRRAILTENFDYTTADDIRVYLDLLFKDDNRKLYFTIEKEELDEGRKDKSSFPIKGCQSQHMFSFFPSGEVQSKVNICSCEECLVGKFTQCVTEPGKIVQHAYEGYSDDSDSNDFEADDGAESEDDETEAIELRGGTILEAIAVGNIIGLLTPENSHDPFYLCLVNDFGIANTPLGKGHNFVAPG